METLQSGALDGRPTRVVGDGHGRRLLEVLGPERSWSTVWVILAAPGVVMLTIVSTDE